MIYMCPNCSKTFVVGFDNTDFVHTCDSGKEVFDNEDVLVVGNWEDFSGSGTKAKQEVMMAGHRAGVIEGANEFNVRGNRKTTHRQRQKYSYIELKKKENCLDARTDN
jgi:hypothetical protein